MKRTSWRGGDIITALLALVREACPDVQVLDGQPTRLQHVEDTVILVGADPLAQVNAVSRREEPDLGGRVTETGEVSMMIATLRGDGDPKVARDEVERLLVDIEAALHGDFDLGDSTDEAWIGDQVAFSQAQTDKGAAAQISTSIAYRAWI